jgi:septum formation protein
MKNAERKVRAVAKTFSENEKNICIIGADTLVTFGNEVIGKPKDKHEAQALLRKFSGARLEVYTGLFLLMLKNQRQAQGYEKSSVKVKTIDQSKFEKYFLKLGPHDKAGGFSIEGAGSFVFDDIEGSYFNILGLPMTKLNELFAEIGLDLLDFCE